MVSVTTDCLVRNADTPRNSLSVIIIISLLTIPTTVGMGVYSLLFNFLFVLAWIHCSTQALVGELLGDKFDFLVIMLFHEAHNNRLYRRHTIDTQLKITHVIEHQFAVKRHQVRC